MQNNHIEKFTLNVKCVCNSDNIGVSVVLRLTTQKWWYDNMIFYNSRWIFHNYV